MWNLVKRKQYVYSDNAIKRCAIAEHLVNSPNCAANLDFNRFKIIEGF